jgi:hypothetical protein
VQHHQFGVDIWLKSIADGMFYAQCPMIEQQKNEDLK